MKIFTFLLILSISFTALGQQLSNHALILTHTSRYYHTSNETILATQELIQNAKGEVIALVQNPLSKDSDWYGLPLNRIQREIPSRAGEHKITFPLIHEVDLTVAGGYLSACLGRTLSDLISRFISESDQTSKLNIHLPMKAIFTGFVEKQNKLIPLTPYQESILDLSMDGLNLEQTLALVPEEQLKQFLAETIYIAVLDKSPMPKISKDRFSLKATLNGKQIYQIGNSSLKEITLSFE